MTYIINALSILAKMSCLTLVCLLKFSVLICLRLL